MVNYFCIICIVLMSFSLIWYFTLLLWVSADFFDRWPTKLMDFWTRTTTCCSVICLRPCTNVNTVSWRDSFLKVTKLPEFCIHFVGLIVINCVAVYIKCIQSYYINIIMHAGNYICCVTFWVVFNRYAKAAFKKKRMSFVSLIKNMLHVDLLNLMYYCACLHRKSLREVLKKTCHSRVSI